MSIYTGSGDKGETSLFGGRRVGKDHPSVQACGAIDELNSMIGLARVACNHPELLERLARVQEDLFVVGASLARSMATPVRPGDPALHDQDVVRIEGWIDQAAAAVPPMRCFVLPGGTDLAARLHAARAVCRRAERTIVSLPPAEPPEPLILRFMNRLSDLLFVWARLANHLDGVKDIPWPGKSPG